MDIKIVKICGTTFLPKEIPEWDLAQKFIANSLGEIRLVLGFSMNSDMLNGYLYICWINVNVDRKIILFYDTLL